MGSLIQLAEGPQPRVLASVMHPSVCPCGMHTGTLGWGKWSTAVSTAVPEATHGVA